MKAYLESFLLMSIDFPQYSHWRCDMKRMLTAPC